MPLLRKGILIPEKGVDWSQPSTFVDDRAGFPQNMRVLKKEMRKRPGKTLYGASPISDNTQIMGLGVLELASIKYLIRASKTKLERFNTTTGAWDSINDTPFAGGDEDFMHFANVPESSLIAMTNGIDRIRKWTGVGNNALLGGSPPICKYMAYLSPYLILAHITDGDVLPWKVQWCDTGKPEVWSGGNAGSELLTDEASQIQNIMKMNEYAAVYKEDSLWLGRKIDTSEVFKFDCVKTGVGLASPKAVADAGGQHYFMGLNDFYVWNGLRPESIGAPVRDRVFSTIDREKIKRCFALFIKNLQEVWFFVFTTGQTWPTEVWKYSINTGFWYYDTCTSLTAAIAWKKVATDAWNDISGSWDEQFLNWDENTTVQEWEQIVFGNVDGNTAYLDYNVTDDLGVAVSSIFETKDYVADTLEFDKRWLQLDVWVSGSEGAKLYVDYSIDRGNLWTNIPYTTSQVYIELSSSVQLFRMYPDILSPHIRFRFRNAESNEIFTLRNFYPYYAGFAEVKT